MAGNPVRETSSRQSFSDVLIQSILIAFLFVIPWSYGLTRFRDQLFAQSFVFGLFLFAIPFLPQKFGFKVGRNPLDAWVFLGLLTGFLYCLFSTVPYQSLLAFLRLLVGVIFYGLIRSGVRTEGAVRAFLWAILVLGFFYSAYGLLQFYGPLSHSFWYQPFSLASRYVNGGHFAAFLLFPLFMGLSLLVSTRRFISQFILISLLLIVVWALLLTRSRSVWIASLVGLAVFVGSIRRNKFVMGKMVFGLAFFAIMVGVLFFLGGRGEVIGRFQDLGKPVYSSLGTRPMKFYNLVYRWNLWEGAWRAIVKAPWGWGLGTFSSVFPQFQVHVDRFLVDYAHNEVLQAGVDLGIPGVLILLGLIALYLHRGFHLLKQEELHQAQRATVAGFLAIFISLVLVSQFDFPLRIFSTGILFATFLGLSAHVLRPLKVRRKVLLLPDKTAASNRGAIPLRLIAVIFVLVAELVTASQLFAELHFEKAKRLDENFDWNQAEKNYELAARLAPLYGPYHETLGFFYERKASVTFNQSQRKALSTQALASYREASRLQPYRGMTHYLVALLYKKRGEFAQAQSEFLKAIALEPKYPPFLIEYGYFAIKHLGTEDAIEAFERFKGIAYSYQENSESKICQIVQSCYQVTQDYEQLNRVITDDWQGHSCLAQLMGEKGRWNVAKLEFDLALERAALEPNHDLLATERWIAETYLSHNRIQEAFELYEKIVATNPQDLEARKKLQGLSEKLKPPPPLLPSPLAS